MKHIIGTLACLSAWAVPAVAQVAIYTILDTSGTDTSNQAGM